MKTAEGRCSAMRRSKTDLLYFKLSYMLNNTALVMPVLPFWWTGQISVPMDEYLSVLAMATMFALMLDFPLSVAADIIGAKYAYGAGLVVFAFSFLFAATAQGEGYFLLYAFSNALASSLMAGASNALLFNIVGEELYRSELYAINRLYYVGTGLLFFAGVGIYLWDARVLMYLQSVMLAASAFFVFRMRVSASDNVKLNMVHEVETAKISEVMRLGWGSCRAGLIGFAMGALALCLLTGFFNGLMQFQNRTIQLISGQFSIAGINSLWTSALFLCIGNVITSFGVGSFVEKRLSVQTGIRIASLFLCIAAVAVMLISLGSIIGALSGYLLICVLKGAYRAEYGDMAMRTIPFEHWEARWISVVNTVAGLIGSCINLAATGYAGSDVVSMQRFWAVVALVLICGTAVLLKQAEDAYIPLVKQGMSGKISVLRFFFDSHEEPVFGQIYPDHQTAGRIIEIYKTTTSQSGLRAVPLYRTVRGREVDFKYIKAPSLYDIALNERWNCIVQSSLLEDLARRDVVEVNHGDRECIRLGSSNLMHASGTVCTCGAYSHGDLNPGNIMIMPDGSYELVDWDLAGIKPRIFDEFSLLFHPDTPVEIKERLRKFEELKALHDEGCPFHAVSTAVVVRLLLEAKILDCQSWGSAEGARLASGYLALAAEVGQVSQNED